MTKRLDFVTPAPVQYRSPVAPTADVWTPLEVPFDEALGEFETELRFVLPDADAAVAAEAESGPPRLTLVVHGRQYDSYGTRLTDEAMQSVVTQINSGNVDVHDGHVSWHPDKGPEHYVGRLTNARIQGDDVVADVALLPIDGPNANVRAARIVKTLRGGGRLGSSMVFRTLKFIPKTFDRPWEGGDIAALDLLAVDIVTGAAYKRARGSVRLNSTQAARGSTTVLLQRLESDEGERAMDPEQIRALIAESIKAGLTDAVAPLTQRLEAVEAGLQARGAAATDQSQAVVAQELEGRTLEPAATTHITIPLTEYRALVADDLERKQQTATRTATDDGDATAAATAAAEAAQRAPAEDIRATVPTEFRAVTARALQEVGLA